MSEKKKILIFSEYYLPGYKSGGGMRTVVNIVNRLGKRYDFYIITRDYDGRTDKTQYRGVKIGEWNTLDNSKVFYLQQKEEGLYKILELIEQLRPDIIYSNSYFSTVNVYLLLLNKLGKLKQTPYVISPCGELSADSLKFNALKKKIFIKFSKTLRLDKNVFWKVTTKLEQGEIEELGFKKENIFIAPDLPPESFNAECQEYSKPDKKNGSAKFIFLSRICRKKNLKFFLEKLYKVSGNIEFDIYGPVVDRKYWDDCKKIIRDLPGNVKVEFRGSIPHEKVFDTLQGYHFFVMPTLNENFGHIFLEAFSAGCPVVISNRTPWLKLQKKKIGWDIALEKDDLWTDTIERCVTMDQKEFSEWSDNAIDYAAEWLKQESLERQTVEMFDSISSNTLIKPI